MSVIKVENLQKTFKVKLKEKGFIGSIKSIIKPKYKKVEAVRNIPYVAINIHTHLYNGFICDIKKSQIKILFVTPIYYCVGC